MVIVMLIVLFVITLQAKRDAVLRMSCYSVINAQTRRKLVQNVNKMQMIAY